MKDIVMCSADHWTTNWYDKIQWMQQKIYHWLIHTFKLNFCLFAFDMFFELLRAIGKY